MINKTLKKLSFVILILTLAITSTSCGPKDEEYFKYLDKDAHNLYDQLSPVFADAQDNKEICDFIVGIADKNLIFSKTLPNDNLILVKDTDLKNGNYPDVTYHCTISKDGGKSQAQSVAIALSLLFNSRNHGKVTVLLTSQTKGEFVGASSLPKEYLETDNLIHLSYSSEAKIFMGSASISTLSLTGTVEPIVPTYSKAYRVSISGLTGADSGDQSRHFPNPIYTLGSLLSTCQSSGILLQLASFNGGQGPDTFPTNCEALVVVNGNDEAKFLRKVDSSKEKFIDKYGDKESNLTYTCEPAELPPLVFSDDDTARFVSLMYTAEDGVFATSEEKENKGETLAICNIGQVLSSDTSIDVLVSGRSIDKATMDRLQLSYSQIAHLNNYEFHVSDIRPIWVNDKENPLAKKIEIFAKKGDWEATVGSTFQSSPCTHFLEKNPTLTMVSLGIKIQDSKEVTKSLALFMESLSPM